MIFEKQVVNGYKGMMFSRCDDTESVFYFSAADFPGLMCEEFSFASSLGHTLFGYFYAYDGFDDKRLIVFDHGFGGGHRAYMREIEKLARHGYRVLAYDHTGCMESGGASPNGLAQSLVDLNDCIAAVKADARFSGIDISVVGHSWGAFSTMNVTALHPEISHIVAMCGYVSVEDMINTLFPGLLRGYRHAVLALERAANPEFSSFNAARSLAASNTRALLIYSADDTLCRPVHYEILSKALAGRDNVKLLLVNGKGHNPNYTRNAVRLLSEFGRARARLLKRKGVTSDDRARFVASFDWHAITEQDEEIWEKIFLHLDS